MRKMIMPLVALLLIVAACGQQDSFLGSWTNDEEVDIEVISTSPCEVHLRMDGDISRFYESGSDVSDDGTFDWALVENDTGGVFGVRFPRNTHAFIEIVLFNEYNEIDLTDRFYRP